MKNKHYIKTVEDIKYCEEKGLKIYPRMEGFYFEFRSGVWNEYDENDSLVSYQTTLFVSDNLYYEEEPIQEAIEEDVGKLCWFWDDECNKRMGILDHIEDGLYYVRNWFYGHCRRLSPAEVAEMTGYKVEEKAE